MIVRKNNLFSFTIFNSIKMFLMLSNHTLKLTIFFFKFHKLILIMLLYYLIKICGFYFVFFREQGFYEELLNELYSFFV
jgi:hypothetical protein